MVDDELNELDGVADLSDLEEPEQLAEETPQAQMRLDDDSLSRLAEIIDAKQAVRADVGGGYQPTYTPPAEPEEEDIESLLFTDTGRAIQLIEERAANRVRAEIGDPMAGVNLITERQRAKAEVAQLYGQALDPVEIAQINDLIDQTNDVTAFKLGGHKTEALRRIGERVVTGNSRPSPMERSESVASPERIPATWANEYVKGYQDMRGTKPTAEQVRQAYRRAQENGR